MNPVNNTISTDTLKPTPALPLANNIVDSNVYNSAISQTQADIQGGLNNAQNEVNATRKTAKDQSLAISTLQSLSGGQGAETIKQYDNSGVTGLFNQLTDLNSQAVGLKNEAQAIPIQLQNQSTNRGVTVGGMAPIQSAQLRENALKALSLGQQYAIASGNYEKAKDYADKAIAAKYQQIDADIKAKQMNLATLEKYDLSPAETKLLNLQNLALKREEQANAEKKANEKGISDIIIQGSTQGAPSALLNRAKLAKTPAEAAMILGQYSGDYYKTELLKSQIKTDAAQRANYYANAAKTNAERRLLSNPDSQLQFGNIKTAQDLQNATTKLKLTEGQGKSLAFAQRAINADKALQERLKVGYDPTTTTSAVGRTYGTDNARGFKRDLSDFITAVLRKESGATITPDEFALFTPLYSPQGIGTNAQDITQTNTKRQGAIDSLISEAGPAAPALSSYKQNNQIVNTPVIVESKNPILNSWFTNSVNSINNVNSQPKSASSLGFTDNQK